MWTAVPIRISGSSPQFALATAQRTLHFCGAKHSTTRCKLDFCSSTRFCRYYAAKARFFLNIARMAVDHDIQDSIFQEMQKKDIRPQP